MTIRVCKVVMSVFISCRTGGAHPYHYQRGASGLWQNADGGECWLLLKCRPLGLLICYLKHHRWIWSGVAIVTVAEYFMVKTSNMYVPVYGKLSITYKERHDVIG